MTNLMPVFQLAHGIGSLIPSPTPHSERGSRGTAFDVALTVGTLGIGGAALSGTRAARYAGTGMKWFGYVRYPLGSAGVKLGVPGARQYLFASKVYAGLMLAYGIHEFDRNQALFRQKEYKKLGISLMGPPGSLWLYDKIYNGPAKESLASSSTPSQQNGGAKGNKKTPRKSKKSTKKMIKPQWSKYASACPPGYRFRYVNGDPMCVKK